MPPRLFSITYPSGRPGVGLLLLRSAVGLAAAQGGVYLSGSDEPSLLAVAACLLALAAGSLLLLGFLTPLACVIVGLGGAAAAFSSPPAVTHTPLLGGLFFLPALGATAAALLLGPGAYSLDARLFGRREIIIPQASHPSEP